MNKLTVTFGAAAMILASALTPAAAQQTLTERVASEMGLYIASQGNAALVQIREEMRRELLAQLRPWLPQPKPETNARAGTQPGRTR